MLNNHIFACISQTLSLSFSLSPSGWHGKSPHNQRGHQIRGCVGVPSTTLCERDQIPTGKNFVFSIQQANRQIMV